MQHDPSLLSRKPSEKPYKMFRRNFLNAQLAKALFARNAPPTTANDLPNAEQKAVRELIELDRALADVPDTSEIDLSLIQVAIEKRNDGHINLVFTKSGSKHVRSTTATWATTSE